MSGHIQYIQIIKGELPLANKLGRDMCAVCRKTFSNFKSVTAHMEGCRSANYKMACECGFLFSDLSSLRGHKYK